MNYPPWEATLPKQITGDSLWKVTAYRVEGSHLGTDASLTPPEIAPLLKEAPRP